MPLWEELSALLVVQLESIGEELEVQMIDLHEQIPLIAVPVDYRLVIVLVGSLFTSKLVYTLCPLWMLVPTKELSEALY